MIVITWVSLGIVFGILTHYFDNQDAKGGLMGSILFGVSGALLGGIAAALLFGISSQFDITTLLIALSGTLLLLLFHRTFFSKQERF